MKTIYMAGQLHSYWWQYIPQNIDPVFFKFGPIALHYYGLFYLMSILTVYALCLYRLKKENFTYSYSKATLENFFMWVVIGVLLGGRFGYVLFYNFAYFWRHPLEIMLPFSYEGGFHYTGISGMSYHGGLVGAVLAGVLFCRKYKIDFWNFSDFFIPAVPLGYTFGRLGNFFNSELYGRPTTVAWGMYFPTDPSQQLRHPSQLYEAFFEGILLFVIFWSLRKRSSCRGCLLPLYLIGYGLVRFCIEFYREPDPQLGLVLGQLTLGQIFCLLMVIAGIVILWARKLRQA